MRGEGEGELRGEGETCVVDAGMHRRGAWLRGRLRRTSTCVEISDRARWFVRVFREDARFRKESDDWHSLTNVINQLHVSVHAFLEDFLQEEQFLVLDDSLNIWMQVLMRERAVVRGARVPQERRPNGRRLLGAASRGHWVKLANI